MHRGWGACLLLAGFATPRLGTCECTITLYVQVEGEPKNYEQRLLMESALVREKGRNSVSFAQDSSPKAILDKQICLRHIHMSGDDHKCQFQCLCTSTSCEVLRAKNISATCCLS
ncbi:uncharacterized protein ARMOST_18308 [Armillaria ostoyae]|uniref:Secreted protein n=1 Tax=Armillaria ostoyae TaxID=47428 RepID=A0A284S1I4_ARMOS|nr:uncharacterized protein ARMOST_18308 [Armillaria ostoyae]